MEGLLSIERKQKLDLLSHLVMNLHGSLVLQGEPGSGKSSLLMAAVEQGIRNSDTLLLNADVSLSFESIQYELLQFLNEKYQSDNRSIADVLLGYEKQGKNLVLMIDNAAFLLAGLINALVNYAKEYSALKLVFALTSEEVVAKSQSDGLKNSCHFIELQKLNFSQSSLFVRQLVAAGKTAYTESDINDVFLQKIYQESTGNLGVIKSFLKKNKKRYFNNVLVLMLLLAGIAILSTVVSLFLWRESEVEEKVAEALQENKKATVVKSLKKVTLKKPEVNSNIEKINAAKQFKVKSHAGAVNSVIKSPTPPIVQIPKVKAPQLASPPYVAAIELAMEAKKLSKNNLPVERKTEIEDGAKVALVQEAKNFPEKKAALQVIGKSSLIKKIDDRAWILSQKETTYTMQLMALSSKKALLQEQLKFKKIGYSTYYLLNNTNKNQVYTLYYGVFESVADANKKRLELPVAMQKAWVRKIMTIRKSLSLE